jgi:vacuolar-type H+-ATPase subunit E/Vma4
MSLEEILKDIELRGKQELDELKLYYEKKISDLQAKQDRTLAAQNEKIRKSTEEEKRSAERTIVSSAEMEALNILRSKQGSLVEEAASKAELYLKNMRDRKDYADILGKMVDISRKTLGKDCRIYASKEDSSRISAEGSKIVTKDIDPYGGIRAESADGSRELDLTVTAIVSELREKIVSQFYQHLGE